MSVTSLSRREWEELPEAERWWTFERVQFALLVAERERTELRTILGELLDSDGEGKWDARRHYEARQRALALIGAGAGEKGGGG